MTEWELEEAPERPAPRPRNIPEPEAEVRSPGTAPGNIVPPLLALATLILVPVLSLYLNRGPAASGDVAPDEFSEARARVHVQALAEAPHPIGTEAHRKSEAYILGVLNQLGVSPSVHEATAVVPGAWPQQRAGTTRNIVARIEGSRGGDALLLMAHYDTVPHAPGAGDDSAGVAAVLETARALLSGPDLLNDVVLLLTDGEEAGLLGAEAFVADHPWAEEIALVLNFEGRGSGGPVFLYETSDENGWLIKAVGAAAPHAIATSLMGDVYARMPNDTDLSPFKRAGYQGLNFAYIDGVERYHSARDTSENLDPRSLQHLGSYALSLSRYFGDSDIPEEREPNAAYFNPIGSFFVHYPGLWVVPSAMLLAFVYWCVMEVARYRGHASLRGIAAGSVVFAATASILAASAHFGTQELLKRQGLLVQYMSDVYFLSYTLIAVGFAAAVYALAVSRIPVVSLALGATLWWVVLALITAVIMPGATPLFVWPPFFSLLGLLFLAFTVNPSNAGTLSAIALCVFALPVLTIFTPLTHMFLVAMKVGMAGAAMIWVIMAIGLVLPLFHILTRNRSWALPLATIVSGVAILGAAIYLAEFSPERPDTDFLVYGQNGDTDEAHWISIDSEPDEWTGAVLKDGSAGEAVRDYFPAFTKEALGAKAPSANLETPTVEVLSDGVAAGKRWLHLRVQSPRQAPVMSLYAMEGSLVYAADIQGAGMVGGVYGTDLGVTFSDSGAMVADAFGGYVGTRDWQLQYFGVPPGGIDVWLIADPEGPFNLKVVDQSYGFPDIEGFSLPPRPSHLIPRPKGGPMVSDATLVAKSFTF